MRFRHRANAPSDSLSIKLSREYLRLLFPGLAWSSLNSTCGIRPHSGFKGYRLYAETPRSLLCMRDGVVPLSYGCPLPVSPAASPLALHRPTLSKQCFRFTLHLSSRVVPVTCFVRIVYHELPYRDSCTKLVHELLLQNFAIESRYYIHISAQCNCSGEELAVSTTRTV